MKTYLPLRAILASMIVYLLTFVLGSALFNLLSQTPGAPEDLFYRVRYVGAFLALLVTGVGGWFYFSTRFIRPTTLGGLAFGLTAAAVGFAMHSVVLLAMMTANNQLELLPSALLGSYLDPLYGLTELLQLAVCMAIGHWMGRSTATTLN